MNTTKLNGSFYCQYREPQTHEENLASITSYVILSVLGILGNALVIIFAIKYSLRKNRHLIINMALSDGLFLVALLIYSLDWVSGGRVRPFGKNWQYNVVLCEVNTFFLHISNKVSLITLLVMSIERFRATRSTMHRPRAYSLRRRLAVTGGCWLLLTPITFLFAYIDGRCSTPAIKPHSLWGVLDFIACLICCFIFILSVVTIKRLSKNRTIHENLSEEQRALRTQRTRAAVRMVLVSVLLYVICWMPIFVYRPLTLVQRYLPRGTIIDRTACIDWYSFYFIVFYILPVLNSFFSPLIYIVCLSDFRKAANNLLLCRRFELNRVSPSDNNSTQKT